MKDRKKLKILKTKEQIVSKRTSEGKFWNVNNIGITCRYRVSRYLYKYFLSGILDIFNLPGLFVKFKNNFWLRYDQARMILFWKKSAALPFIYLHPRTLQSLPHSYDFYEIEWNIQLFNIQCTLRLITYTNK